MRQPDLMSFTGSICKYLFFLQGRTSLHNHTWRKNKLIWKYLFLWSRNFVYVGLKYLMDIPLPPTSDKFLVYLVESLYYKWRYVTLLIHEIRDRFSPVEKVVLSSCYHIGYNNHPPTNQSSLCKILICFWLSVTLISHLLLAWCWHVRNRATSTISSKSFEKY